MKNVLWCALVALLLSGCEGWPLITSPYNPQTVVPSRTPSIQTATPSILSPVPSTATTEAGAPTGETPTGTLAAVTPSETLTPIATFVTGSVSVQILGCDTSIDILHGMGEVTNAYLTVSNSTTADVPNLCATLNALDEGRPHRDKTKCLPSLPSGQQVTFKLTVDTTYKENSPVQVNVTSDGNLLRREGEAACTAISLLPPDIDTLGTPQAIPGSATPAQP